MGPLPTQKHFPLRHHTACKNDQKRGGSILIFRIGREGVNSLGRKRKGRSGEEKEIIVEETFNGAGAGVRPYSFIKLTPLQWQSKFEETLEKRRGRMVRFESLGGEDNMTLRGGVRGRDAGGECEGHV